MQFPMTLYLAADVSMATMLIGLANRDEMCCNQLSTIQLQASFSNSELQKLAWPAMEENLATSEVQFFMQLLGAAVASFLSISHQGPLDANSAVPAA